MKNMEETRKGFRFTKKVVSSASAEIVAFDDLNEEISSPVGKKRKPANENIRLEENSRRDTDHVAATVTVMLHSPTKSNATPRSPEKAASSSSRKMSRTETSPLANSKRATKQTKVDVITVEETKASVIKAYYPKIDYDPLDSFVIGKYQDPDMSHKDTLVKLVENICANECAGLKQYSDENNGRKSIIVYLQNILTRLPAEIANATSDSIIFSPELSGDEKYEIESLEQTVATLRQQSLALEKYDTDISELGKKYDMWIDGVPQNIAAASSGSVEKSLDIAQIAEHYDQILNELNNHCGKLTNLTENLHAVKTGARVAQSALYDTAQAVRVKGNSTKVATGDPKDLIRNYLAL